MDLQQSCPHTDTPPLQQSGTLAVRALRSQAGLRWTLRLTFFASKLAFFCFTATILASAFFKFTLLALLAFFCVTATLLASAFDIPFSAFVLPFSTWRVVISGLAPERVMIWWTGLAPWRSTWRARGRPGRSSAGGEAYQPLTSNL